MICEGCGKHHPNAKAFEMEVVEGGKCEALERCLPAAKATLQIAALANMAVDLASIYSPRSTASTPPKVFPRRAEARQERDGADFETAHKAISNEKDKENGVSGKGRRSPTEVAVGVEAAAGGSEVGRLPYEEFVTYLMDKVDEKHRILMQTGLAKRIGGRWLCLECGRGGGREGEIHKGDSVEHTEEEAKVGTGEELKSGTGDEWREVGADQYF